jgi:hypothetical protein
VHTSASSSSDQCPTYGANKPPRWPCRLRPLCLQRSHPRLPSPASSNAAAPPCAGRLGRFAPSPSPSPHASLRHGDRPERPSVDAASAASLHRPSPSHPLRRGESPGETLRPLHSATGIAETDCLRVSEMRQRLSECERGSVRFTQNLVKIIGCQLYDVCIYDQFQSLL